MGDGATTVMNFSYSAPYLQSTDPRIVDAAGYGELLLFARNIGSDAVDVAVEFEDRQYSQQLDDLLANGKLTEEEWEARQLDTTCADAVWLQGAIEWFNDQTQENDYLPYIQCDVPVGPVGNRSVTIYAAFQSVTLDDTIDYECVDGYYGVTGEYCSDCELWPRTQKVVASTGFTCENTWLKDADTGKDNVVEEDCSDSYEGCEVNPVIEYNGVLPYAAAGFYRIMMSVDDDDDMCHDEVKVAKVRELCPAMWPCDPPEACLGNNTCGAQYMGERCRNCAENFYKINGQCKECPSQLWVLPLMLTCAGVACAYIGFKLSKAKVNLGILSIGVDYFQVLAIFAGANVEWPDELYQLYDYLSAFNLNLEIFSPECLQTSWFDYEKKWFFIEAFPVIFIGVALSLFLGKLFWKACVKRRNKKLFSHLPALQGAIFLIMYYLYLYLANTTLAPFNCQATDPDDGFTYMQDVFEPCDQPGGLQQRLLPYAGVAFIVYIIGYPTFCALLIFRHRQKMMEDQTYRAMLKDKDFLKKAGLWNFRKKFYRLYYQFKPLHYYWVCVILWRKFMISVMAVIFRKNPSFQMSLVLLTMFIAYALQVRYSPYMSTSEYESVAEQCEYLVADDIDKYLENAKERARKKHAKVRLGEGKSSRGLNIDVDAGFFHDYNTVESVLLFSAILVNLSGIMFESRQLEPGSAGWTTLTYNVIAVVVFSVSYFMYVLGTEILLAFYPNTKICGKGKEAVERKSDAIRESDFTMFNAENPILANRRSSQRGGAMDPEIYNRLNEQEETIKRQQAAITQLKKERAGGHALNAADKFKGLVKKKKKTQISGGPGANTTQQSSIELSALPRVNLTASQDGSLDGEL